MYQRNSFILIIVIVILSHPFRAEGEDYRLQSDRIGRAGLSFEYWKAQKDKITQFALPITYIYPYSSKLRFYAITSPAFTGLTKSSNYSLNGLSDMKLGGHYLTLNDAVLVTFGLNLPTGKSGLTSDEYFVASTLTIPAFNFRVPSMGQGLDIQLGASTAWEWGDFVVGYGLSLLFKGGFKPYDGFDEVYNPGNEVTFTWGLYRKDVMIFNKEVDIQGDILYTGYSSDKWEGDRVFKSGNKFTLQMLSQFEVDPFDVAVFIRESKKGKNKTGTGDILETENKNQNGNQFEIQGIGYYPYQKDIRLKTILDLKFYSNNEYERGGATLIGLGGGAEMQFSEQLSFQGDLRFYTGSYKSSEKGSAVIGLKFFGGFQYTF